MRSERIASLSRYVINQAANPANTAAVQLMGLIVLVAVYVSEIRHKRRA